MELVRKLHARADAGNPIRVGIAGCGQMGSGLAAAIQHVPGMSVAALADIDPDRAVQVWRDLGVPAGQIVHAERVSAADDALRAGKPVVTTEAMLLPEIARLDANVEVTGVPDAGARFAYQSIMARKPVIMLNVETDVTVGPYLSHLARSMDTIYTVASGDEPGVCKMLYEQAILMGFEVISLGKGKNNPINRAATPESCAAEAAGKGMNPKMLAAFQDGTKTMVEMAAVSNATGLLPDVPGMHGPRAEMDELVRVFIPRSDGGLLARRGVVDFSTGAIAPGVFAIVRSDDARIRKDMKFITRAEGPYYLLLRPYHLCDLETPQSIAEAVLLDEVTVAPEALHSEVAAIAKRDIAAGETVGGIGSADLFGRIYTEAQARAERLVPLGVALGGRATRPIARGTPFTTDSFAPDVSRFIYRLRQLQDALLGDCRPRGRE